MLKVGITGGIGSGKTTVCQVFEALGIPVFYADRAGKWLMEQDVSVIADIKQLFGEDIYQQGFLNRERIASIVFRSPDMLRSLNEIVHPAVLRYGAEWMAQQTSPYALKEAAIFFESGSYKEMDVMVGVYAPTKIRILRAMQRDGSTQEKILERIAQQMNEDEKMSRCQHVIINDDVQAVLPQVLQVHEALLLREKG